jgi:hypothetical protein
MSDGEKKPKLTTYGSWALGSLLNRLTVLRKSEDECRADVQPVVVPAETLKSEGGWEKTICDMLKGSFSDSEKGLLEFFDEVKELRELASECIDKSGRQRYAEDLSLLNELLSEPGCPFMVEIPDDDPQTILLHGYVETFIEEKWETLCKIHEMEMRLVNFLLEDTTLTAPCRLSASQRRTVELLRDLFTDGAGKYPGLAHMVMTWPITRYVPRPPKDEFPDFTFPQASRDLPYTWRASLPTQMLITRETLSTSFLVAHPNADWDMAIGYQRLSGLASQAGRVVAEVLPDCPVWEPKALAAQYYINLWLQIVHLLRQTCRHNDGWDGLFDDDSDFWDEAWRKGLYQFWKSDDVFLDSAFACNVLITWGDDRQPGTVPVEARATISSSGEAPADTTVEAKKETRKITREEANIEVRRLLKETPSWDWTVTKLADKIGCSRGLISQCPAWKAYKERRDRVRKEGTINTVSLTSEMEAVLGAGEPDEVLQQLIAEQEEEGREDARHPKLYLSHEKKPKKRES